MSKSLWPCHFHKLNQCSMTKKLEAVKHSSKARLLRLEAIVATSEKAYPPRKQGIVKRNKEASCLLPLLFSE